MFSRSSSILRCLQLNVARRSCTSHSRANQIDAAAERDPAPLFFDESIHNILKTLTRPDIQKVFRVRKEGRPIADTEYKFMTTEELTEAREEAFKRLEVMLQMPPVVQKRKPITGVLSKDPALQGYETGKHIFMDITYGGSHTDRLIVVREPNGLLRHADWDERFRMNQIYDPIEGRELRTPKMFSGEYFEDLIAKAEYEFILDRACVQFDPDDPEYHRVVQAVYEAVNNAKASETLRSTRHYGPLVFHLVWTKNITNLLLENLTHSRTEDTVLLIKLYNKIHPTSKSAEMVHDGDDLKFILNYIEIESDARGKLLAAFHAFKELDRARKAVDEGVKKAHGLTE